MEELDERNVRDGREIVPELFVTIEQRIKALRKIRKERARANFVKFVKKHHKTNIKAIEQDEMFAKRFRDYVVLDRNEYVVIKFFHENYELYTVVDKEDYLKMKKYVECIWARNGYIFVSGKHDNDQHFLLPIQTFVLLFDEINKNGGEDLREKGKGGKIIKTVDHINRNTFDNRRENLRLTSVNIQNGNKGCTRYCNKLPIGCGIDITEIPKWLSYRAKDTNTGHDHSFDLGIKNVTFRNVYYERFRKSLTKASDVSLRYKLCYGIKVINYLRDEMELDDNNNERLVPKNVVKQLSKSFNKIIKLSKFHENDDLTCTLMKLPEEYEIYHPDLTDEELERLRNFDPAELFIGGNAKTKNKAMPKFDIKTLQPGITYTKATAKRGSFFVIERRSNLAKQLGTHFQSTSKRDVSDEDKYNELMRLIDECKERKEKGLPVNPKQKNQLTDKQIQCFKNAGLEDPLNLPTFCSIVKPQKGHGWAIKIINHPGYILLKNKAMFSTPSGNNISLKEKVEEFKEMYKKCQDKIKGLSDEKIEKIKKEFKAKEKERLAKNKAKRSKKDDDM